MAGMKSGRESQRTGWIDRASAILTIFLLWFGFSQFGLLLHGLVLWRGYNPLVVLRSEPPAALPPPDEDQFVLVDEVGLDENDENPEKMK
jgi:hypothetical protein